MKLPTNKFYSMATLTAEHFRNYLKRSKNFEENLKDLKIISLDKGKCVAEMEIEEKHTNPIGTLHGGLTATLVDVVSSYGLNSIEEGNVAHVSVNMNIRFMTGGRLGRKIIIESETAKCGKRLAFLECTISDKETGTILAKGEQTKYLLNS